MREFKLLQQVKDEPSKNEKMRLLKENATDDLKEFLHYAMNRFINFRVNQIEEPTDYNRVQPNTFEDFFQLLDKLASHTWGTLQAKSAIKAFLSKNTKENAEWFIKCIRKDLGIGLDEKSCNKIWPNLIPVFDIQKGEAALDYWDEIKFPCLVEQKLNGLRCVAIVKDGVVSLKTGKGFDFPCKSAEVRKQILKLSAGKDCVFDSEFYPIRLNSNLKKVVDEHATGSNQWTLTQANSMCRSTKFDDRTMSYYMGLKVWDVIPYDYFISQGSQGVNKPLSERRTELFALFNRLDDELLNISLVDSWIVNSYDEIWNIFNHFKSLNLEGVMIKDLDKPYEFKRSRAILKLKVFKEFDLRIVGAEEGKPDGKFVGTLGALLLEGNKVSGKCGTGFDDKTRDLFWEMFFAGTLVGQICEVVVQEISKDNKLVICSFKQLRPDKDDVSETC